MTQEDITIVEDDETNINQEFHSYPKMVFWFLKQILFVSGSFDFSWSLVFLTILIGNLQTSENETNPLAIAPLTLTLFEMLTITFMSVYFGYSQELSPEFQKLPPSIQGEYDPEILNEMGLLYKSGLVISLPLIAAVMLPSIFSEETLIALGQDPTVAETAQNFSRILAISVTPAFIRFLTEQFFMSANKFKVPMLIAGPNLLLGTGLGAFLAFGSPKLGLEGVGLGFVASAFLNAIFFIAYAKRFQPFSKIPFFSQWHWSSIIKQLPKIMKNGFPFMLQWFGELSAGFALSIFAGQLGVNSLASWNSVQGLIFLTNLFRIASGVTALNRFGAANTHSPQNALRELKASLIASYVLVAPFCIATLIEPKLVLWVFSNTASLEVEAMTKNLSRIISAGILGSAPNMIFMFAPKIKGDLWKPHAITITSVWAGAGLGYTLANKTTLDVNGLAVGFTAGAFVSTIANGIRFFKTINPSTITNPQSATPSTPSKFHLRIFDDCCRKIKGQTQPTEADPLLGTINP